MTNDFLREILDGRTPCAPTDAETYGFDVDPSWFYPTHVSRSEELIAEAAELSRRGMPIDIDVVNEDLPRWVKLFRDGPVA